MGSSSGAHVNMVVFALNDLVLNPCIGRSLQSSLRAALRMLPRTYLPTGLPSLESTAARKHCESSAWGSTSVASARALGRTHGENEVADHQVVALESRGVCRPLLHRFHRQRLCLLPVLERLTVPPPCRRTSVPTFPSPASLVFQPALFLSQPSMRFAVFRSHLKGLYGGLHFTLALLLLSA